ncbi:MULTISPECIES: DUF1501 domain-containing protein [Mycobacteriaceae]|uniref:DUF1501 domain-containing protein n=1 Tax=Mycolicibacterium mucogenicum TaxID=56689 RepID=A0A4R5WL09_MYCMU|nr:MULTISPECIES: DUF1501 domain-containing protein [Mycobacteriaceae]OKH84128.1 hypothetical protein EB75_06485 [Mycobacterium sp. ST-F2]TDK91739.1 DUF1501 domain-containing protein [Mycolicibacterium mucogenicum]
MAEFNRRKFLIASAGVGAAGLLGGVAAVTLPDLLNEAQDRPLAKNSGILVIVTLYGGNDGLSTVIPYADNAYHDLRPDLAYKPEEVLRLDSAYGLNPALTGMSELWQSKKLAIVRGVGYPKQDRSHFRSMDIWQTANPVEAVTSGWIGRWLDTTGDDPIRAVNIGTVLPPLAVGEKHVAASLSDFVPAIPDDVAKTLAALSAGDPHDTLAMGQVCQSYKDTQATNSRFDPVLKGRPQTDSEAANQLASDLDLVAGCIRAGVPTQVYMTHLLGFDTHADEMAPQRALLKTLDDALTPFFHKLQGSPYGRNVVVLMYSEFGRRVAANASQGTDHGTSGPVFIAGTRVKGGFYGDEPSLTDLTDGDLKTTVDFRDVYHELLAHTLGADPEPSVGKGRRDIGFFAGGK